jgi:hypothetical protein
MEFPFWPYPLERERPRNQIEVRFWNLHELHPEIYERIDRECKLLISNGRTHYGVQSFFESIRWETDLSMQEGENGELFKMNNDFPAYYARLWLQNNPFFWDFFELRRVKGEYPKKPRPNYDQNGQGQFWS